MKLSVRGGRVEGNIFLSAAAAGRSLCAIRWAAESGFETQKWENPRCKRNH